MTFFFSDPMTPLLSQNNARGSGEPCPTTKSPRRLSGRYLHMIWTASVTTRKDEHDETLSDINSHDERSDGSRCIHDQSVPEEAEKIDSVLQVPTSETGVALDRSPVSSVTSGVSAALLTLAKHCPTHLGWKTKAKRRYGALEAEDSPKTSRRYRQLIGLGRPRQEEVLLAWLIHPLIPSDVHGESTEVVQHHPCDSEVATAQQESSSHVSIKRRKTAHRVSLTSIPEVDEGWSYWLTRPLRTPWTFETSPRRELPSPTPETTSTACGGDATQCTSSTSQLSRSLTTSATVAPVSSIYVSCFASPHRPPSVIHWKFS